MPEKLIEQGDYEGAWKAAREANQANGYSDWRLLQGEFLAQSRVEGLKNAMISLSSLSTNVPSVRAKSGVDAMDWMGDRLRQRDEVLQNIAHMRTGYQTQADWYKHELIYDIKAKLNKFRESYGEGVEWARARLALSSLLIEIGQRDEAEKILEQLRDSRLDRKGAAALLLNRLKWEAHASDPEGRPLGRERFDDGCLGDAEPEWRAECLYYQGLFLMEFPEGVAEKWTASAGLKPDKDLQEALMSGADSLSANGKLSDAQWLQLGSAIEEPAALPDDLVQGFLKSTQGASATPLIGLESVRRIAAMIEKTDAHVREPGARWMAAAAQTTGWRESDAFPLDLEVLRMEVLAGFPERAEKRVSELKKTCAADSGISLADRDACLRFGMALKRQFRLEAAKSLFGAMGGTKNVQQCEALKELGWTHWREKGDAAEARMYETFAKFLEGNCKDEEEQELIALRTARRMETTGELERAAAILEAHIAAYPGRHETNEARYRLAKIYEKQGHAEEAKKLFEQIVAAEPPHFYSYYLWRSGKFKRPDRTMERPTEIPIDSDCFGRAIYWHDLRIDDLFEGTVDYCIGQGEESLGLRTAKAEVLSKRGDYLNAIKMVEDILEEGKSGQVPTAWRGVFQTQLFPTVYKEAVDREAKRNGIDEALIFGLIRQESRFMKRIASASDARGLMQIIPSTGKMIAKELGIENFSADRMWEPELNVKMGSWYVKYIRDERTGDKPHLIFAGYNAGPARAERWQKEFGDLPLDEFIDAIPIDETRNYVKKCLYNYWVYQDIFQNAE